MFEFLMRYRNPAKILWHMLGRVKCILAKQNNKSTYAPIMFILWPTTFGHSSANKQHSSHQCYKISISGQVYSSKMVVFNQHFACYYTLLKSGKLTQRNDAKISPLPNQFENRLIRELLEYQRKKLHTSPHRQYYNRHKR